MKIILDLSEETIDSLNYQAEMSGKTVNEVVEYLVETEITEPNNVFENEEVEDIQKFSKLFFEYMNEAIYDLESLSNSDEAYPEDLKIAEAFKELNRYATNNAKLLSLMYDAYKN